MPVKRRRAKTADGLTELDARTFQHQLDQLADTICYKVHREGQKKLSQPPFTYADIYMLMRQAHQFFAA